jgi:hypothetical protein
MNSLTRRIRFRCECLPSAAWLVHGCPAEQGGSFQGRGGVCGQIGGDSGRVSMCRFRGVIAGPARPNCGAYSDHCEAE